MTSRFAAVGGLGIAGQPCILTIRVCSFKNTLIGVSLSDFHNEKLSLID